MLSWLQERVDGRRTETIQTRICWLSMSYSSLSPILQEKKERKILPCLCGEAISFLLEGGKIKIKNSHPLISFSVLQILDATESLSF